MSLKRCYFIRHQAGGVLTDKVFLVPPTAQDLEEAQAACAKLHGAVFAKTGEPWWVKVVESTVEVPDGFTAFEELPPPPPAAEPNGLGADGAAALPRLAVTGTGVVTNPGDS